MCLLASSKRAVMCLLLGFCLVTTIKARFGSAVLLEGSPISTEKLCQSDHRALGQLPDQGPSPPIAQAASSGKSLGGSKFLPCKNGGHCVLGDLVSLSVWGVV
jgi:hypothetical protein